MLTFIGTLLLASVSFILGRFFAESEKILAEKRKAYLDFLSVLPALNDTYLEQSDDEFSSSFKSVENCLPRLLFYAGPSVAFAWSSLHEKYWEAHSSLDPTSPALAPEFNALAQAQNDLVLEMRRDAFRWSIFSYHGKSRLALGAAESLDRK